jgi:hypothetical protein
VGGVNIREHEAIDLDYCSRLHSCLWFVSVCVTSEMPYAATAIGTNYSDVTLFPDLAAFALARYRRSDMTKSKLRFGFPLAIALATVSVAAVAQGKCQSGGCLADAKITTNVQALLDRHPELGPPNSVTVRTRAGVVYLYGEVNSGLERETAESLAGDTTGVARVVDSIFVSH